MKVPNDRLGLDQGYEENKAAFVNRLEAAGWTRKDAESEYRRIQEDVDG